VQALWHFPLGGNQFLLGEEISLAVVLEPVLSGLEMASPHHQEQRVGPAIAPMSLTLPMGSMVEEIPHLLQLMLMLYSLQLDSSETGEAHEKVLRELPPRCCLPYHLSFRSP
jgi:hypothetical protein